MAKKLAQITDSLVDSFRKHGGINHLDQTNLPSREAVVEITRDLLRLVFPGFYDKEPIHSNQIVEYTSELVSSVARRLEGELGKSLEYRPCEHCDRKDLAGTAARVTEEFLQELPGYARFCRPTWLRPTKAIRRQSATRKSFSRIRALRR